MIIKVKLSFDPRGHQFYNSSVIVRIEDVSVQDLPAVEVLKTVIDNVSWGGDPGDTRVITITPSVELDPRRMYNLRVHVDVDRNGEISKGDFVTTAAYPILPNHAMMDIPVLVKYIV